MWINKSITTSNVLYMWQSMPHQHKFLSFSFTLHSNTLYLKYYIAEFVYTMAYKKNGTQTGFRFLLLYYTIS
jgi:hypothetical protein